MVGTMEAPGPETGECESGGSDRIAAVYPPGTILEARQLVASGSAALVVDYQRDELISGTWFSRDMHYIDLTLTKRPRGAFGRFPITGDEPRPVGPILFAPAGFAYDGQGGRGRQKSLALLIAPSLLASDEIDEVIASELAHCVSLNGESMRRLLAQIEREVVNPGFASKLLLDGLCLILLVEVARTLRGMANRKPHSGGLSARSLRIIKERVQLDGAPPTLVELAELCAISQRHLIRTFHAEMGETVGEYVQKVRLQRAKDLLSFGDLPIATIARKVGFASQASFATAFRRMTGCSPSVYKDEATR